MPKANWLVFDTQTELYLKTYSIDINSCQWSNVIIECLHFLTEQDCIDLINTWEGGSQNGRFIGKNPTIH